MGRDMGSVRFGGGIVPRLFGISLDPDDLRIIRVLYFRGVQSTDQVRSALGISRVTFFLRLQRLKRLDVVEDGLSAINAARHTINLSLSARQRLFDLESDIRAGGVFEGRLVGDGTNGVSDHLSR